MNNLVSVTMPNVTPSYMDSANLFLSRLAMAEKTDEIQPALDEMEKMAKETPAALTILGLSFLLEGKPWYDFKRGFRAIQDAAEGDEPFCWFILGSLYLNGRPEIGKDPILAKYWIMKAAEAGYPDAILIQEKKWGNENSIDSLSRFHSKQHKIDRKRIWLIGIGLVVLIGIAIFSGLIGTR